MNCFSPEDGDEREPRPILAPDGEHLDEHTLAEFVANFDPQSGDCRRHLDCDARAWGTLEFSAGHPETGKHPPRFHFNRRSCRHQGRSSLPADHTPTSEAASGRFALPCTFLVVSHPNKKFGDALSISPQAGCFTRSQSLWALWATLSAKFVLLLSSSLSSAARRERPTLPALRVAWVGLAPRRYRPLVHVRWGVAPRAPVQGR